MVIGYTGLTMDALDMRFPHDETFDVALDKGTLDALLVDCPILTLLDVAPFRWNWSHSKKKDSTKRSLEYGRRVSCPSWSILPAGNQVTLRSISPISFFLMVDRNSDDNHLSSSSTSITTNKMPKSSWKVYIHHVWAAALPQATAIETRVPLETGSHHHWRLLSLLYLRPHKERINSTMRADNWMMVMMAQRFSLLVELHLLVFGVFQLILERETDLGLRIELDLPCDDASVLINRCDGRLLFGTESEKRQKAQERERSMWSIQLVQSTWLGSFRPRISGFDDARWPWRCCSLGTWW